MYILPENKNVDISRLETIFGNYTNSYKFYWFKAIIEEIMLNNKEIMFKSLVCRMLCNIWYPITEFYLNLGVQDQLNKYIIEIKGELNLYNNISIDKLYNELYNYKNIDKIIKEVTKYVPYRLLHPFFIENVTGKKDSIINDIIWKLSNNTDNAIYKICKEEQKIIINHKWFEYLYENQVIIFGWLDYKIIQFLQKKNPNIPAIPFKLKPPVKRELGTATKLWKYIINKNKVMDIYTGIELNEKNYIELGTVSIDHFVPWSFVLHDEMWNLVPTFKNINSAKSNKLPDNNLVDVFCELQYIAFITLKQTKNKKILEEYLNIYNKLDIRKIFNEEQFISKEEFFEHLRDTIQPLIQIAYNQGYEVWKGWKSEKNRI